MNPERQEDVLDRNIRRLMGACEEQVEQSCRDFLARLERGPVSAPKRAPRSWTWVPVAAGLLGCAAILWAIVRSGRPEVPMAEAPGLAPAAEAPGQEEQELRAQIEKLQAVLAQTSDPTERPRIQASIDRLRADLARAREGKKPSPPPVEPEKKKVGPSRFEELTQAIEKNPGDASLYIARAEEGLKTKGWAGAEKDARKAIKLAPTNARAHDVLGRALVLLRRTDEARQAFARAVELDPKLAGVAKFDPAEEHRMKLQDEMNDLYGKIKMAKDPAEKAAYEMKVKELGQELKILSQGDPLGINIKELELRLEANPDDVAALVDRARWHLDGNRAAPALKDLDRAVELKPDHAPAYLARAVARAMAGDLEKAGVDLKRGIELDPKDRKAIEYAQGTVKKLAQARKDRVRPPEDVARRIAGLRERLEELRAMAANADLSAQERERARQEADRVQTEIENLRASLKEK